MAVEHVGGCVISLLIREMQIKTIMKCHLSSASVTIDENVGKCISPKHNKWEYKFAKKYVNV